MIPAYNEGDNIAPVLRELNRAVKATPVEVLVVHDFEEDTTVPVVRGLAAEMPGVRLHLNRLGRGALNAIRAGFAEAQAPYVLVMMADGSDDSGVVDSMLSLARDGADVVAASRYMRGGKQIGGPLLKRILSRIAGLSLYWLRALPIHDATNNFRLYSRRLLSAVEVESTAGFELALELTVKAQALGMSIAEVPVTWLDRTAGQSRFRLWRWLPHYLKWYRRCVIHRLRPTRTATR